MFISKPGFQEVSNILGLEPRLEPVSLQTVNMRIGIVGPMAVLCSSQCQVHLCLPLTSLNTPLTPSASHWFYLGNFQMTFQVLMTSASLPHAVSTSSNLGNPLL